MSFPLISLAVFTVGHIVWANLRPRLNRESMRRRFDSNNGCDLVDSRLNVSGVAHASRAKLGELDLDDRVGRDMDIWW